MILDELINDVNLALGTYIKKFRSYEYLPENRKIDIEVVKGVLKKSDAVLICKELHKYLDSISTKIFLWMTFVDLNYFVSLLKGVLKKPQYQEIDLLRTLIKEKNQIIKKYEEEKINGVEDKNQHAEILLLKSENNYLYKMLENLDKRLTALENENANNLQRALDAENELKDFVKQPNQLNTINTKCQGNLPVFS